MPGRCPTNRPEPQGLSLSASQALGNGSHFSGRRHLCVTEAGADETFLSIDKNGDGLLSHDEWSSLPEDVWGWAPARQRPPAKPLDKASEKLQKDPKGTRKSPDLRPPDSGPMDVKLSNAGGGERSNFRRNPRGLSPASACG